MLVDGKALASHIRAGVHQFLTERGLSPTLTVLVAEPDLATRTFLAIKQRVAATIGVSISIREYDASCVTGDVLQGIVDAAQLSDGIIVQLPFPPQVDIEQVLAKIPRSHDVDVIGRDARRAFLEGTSPVLPPVTGAIAAMCEAYNVSLSGANVVVVGNGRLVGSPTATWLRGRGALVSVLEKGSHEMESLIQKADILVLGAGTPHMVTKDMLQPGVVLFDAGTSEDGGKLAGDAHPACREVAGLFTPIPGGIGPVTIALIFENLVTLRYGYAREALPVMDVLSET